LNPYERVMSVLSGRVPDRLPCVNSAGTYTKALMELSRARMPEAHMDPVLMARLGSAAHRFCGLENASIPFDGLVEAEAMGAELSYGRFWPRPRSYLDRVEELKPPKEPESSGRIRVVLDAIRLLKGELGGLVPVNVIVTPPFTAVGFHLIGQARLNVLLRRRPELVRDAIEAAMDFYLELMGLYRDAGADLITLHEVGASPDLMRPHVFDEFVKPYLKRLIKAARLPVILNICGDTSSIIKGMAECEPSAIVIDRASVAEVRGILDRVGKSVPLSGNLSTLVLSGGTDAEIEDGVRRAIREGVKLVSPGCDFRLDTPTENVKTMVRATIKYGRIRLW